MKTAKFRGNKRLAFALACAAGLSCAPPARAINFIFTPAAGMSQQAIDGFNAAGRRWSSLFTDPIDIRLNIDFKELAPNVLGETASTKWGTAYTNARTGLMNNRVTADDFTAYASLPATSVSMLINRTAENPNGAGSATPYYDDGTVVNTSNNTQVSMTTANARALGLYPATFPTLDGAISFSTAFQWDFDPLDGITPGHYDFVGIAAHEIGHAMGHTSGVDNIDAMSAGPTYAAESSAYMSVVDLFRFSTESRARGAGVVDMSADARDKYFSIDGGTTKIVSFSTGVKTGDGRQASHWKDNLGIGIMDPTAALGETLVISPRDKQLFDVTGWNVATNWTWMNPYGANFSAAQQWSTAVAPSATENVTFDIASTYAIGFVANAAVAGTYVKKGDITFQLGGNSYTCNGVYLGETTGDKVAARFNSGSLSVGQVTAGRSDGGSTVTFGLSKGMTATTTTGVTLHPNSTLVLGGATLSGGAVTWSNAKMVVNATSTIAAAVTGQGTVQVDGGTLTFSGTLTTPNNGVINKSGNGAMTIGGTQTHGTTTTLNVTGGTATLNTNSGTTAVANLQINTSAATNFNATQHLRGLNITGGIAKINPANGGRNVRTANLSITNGKLDVTDNKLIVKGGTLGTWNGTGYSGVTGMIKSGRGAGAAWDGSGIITSMSAAGASNMLTTLAVATAQSVGKNSFAGVSVASSDVLVMYTYAGDINMSGLVDGDDYLRIDAGFSGNLKGWINGDLDLSGKVDADDYWLIDRSYSRQVIPFNPSSAMADEGLPAGFSDGSSAVPEASGAMVLMILASGLVARRSRRI